jgi:hypothetical protein
MQRWWRIAMAAAASASLAAALGCSGSILLDVNTVPAGTWGGDHAALVVGASASTVQLDCAHGTLDSPIHVDRNGRFDVSGIFVREHGGPIAVGEPEDRHSARFFGSMAGGRLTLFISIGDLGLQMGPFGLTLGAPSHIVRCL